MQSEQPWYIEAAELAEMLFPQAAEAWLTTRMAHLSSKTVREYKLNIRTLGILRQNEACGHHCGSD